MAVTPAEKKELKDTISEKLDSQKEWLEATITPIVDALRRHEKHIEDVPHIKQKLDLHLEDHNKKDGNNKFNIQLWVGIGVLALSEVLAFLRA